MKKKFCVISFVGALALMAVSSESLERGFADPPKANRPQVWWWFDATAPDAAITRDLEGLKRVGISGFHIYGGSVTVKGWLPRVKWSLHEANRLGLDGVVCIGAAGCGHAQTEPSHAQKDLVFTEACVESRNGQDARCPSVILPKKGVKETPKNPDGSPKYYWDIAVLAVPDTANDVPLAEVRDVSRYLNCETGAFEWPDAPDGKWRILRVGYVPKVFGWMGCYIDHMSKSAFDAHWARVMTPLLEALAPDERFALKGVMCDSWEAGTVSWTDTFAEEFRRRRGYDILPWLPVKAGVRLATAPKRARFLRDFNETVSELIAENHYAYQKEVANRHGLVSIAEAAGPHQRQGDVRRMQGRCDVAMGEFWMPSGHRPLPSQRFMVRDAANAAHVYGMDEVLAEAFTTINTYWIESPATMKPCADRAFCDGLTRVCYHGMKLSPSFTDKPGFVRNVGTHYNPQTTWFDQSGAFNLYMSRCSWMLSQGRFAADCLLYAGDAENLFAGLKTPSDGLGEGFDYDFCPTELLLQARVEDGQVVLPSGMRYRVLMFSDRNPKTNGHMRPGPMKKVQEYPPVGLSVSEAVMLKMRELVEGGATLVGSRPSGPTGMNESSERYHAAADALWGPEGRRRVGKGRVFRDRAAARAHLTPDVSFAGPSLDWIHRTLSDGIDIYFVSNQKGEAIKTTVTFRQPEEKSVELWDAVTGARSAAGNNPRVELELPQYGSIFVVFRSKQTTPLAARMGVSSIQTISGPWTVTFDQTWGGPKEPVTFTELTDWTARSESCIRHYSGTAAYRATFDAPTGWKRGQPLQIDLGTVHEVADVQVNGKLVGTAWTAPFAVTATNVKEKGNVLEVHVTNLWPNRLIYDAGLPEGERLTHTNINPYKPGDPLLPSGLLGPVLIRHQQGWGGKEVKKSGLLVLSFDDRYFNDWVNALPIFEKYDAHATFFVKGPIDDDAVRAMKRLSEAGHSVGLHGLRHANADEALAAKGVDRYYKEEIEPQREACRVANIPIKSFAYPNCRRSDETDELFRKKGFAHVRGGHKSVTPFDPKGEKQEGLKPVHAVDRAFIPPEKAKGQFRLDTVIAGEAYHTDIEDILKCVRRCAERNEAFVLTSHGISPDAKGISMKTEWLERILAMAKECGVPCVGFDEL